MRIVYLLSDDFTNHPGLQHKIEGQIHAWERAGHQVFKIQTDLSQVVDGRGAVVFSERCDKSRLTKLTKLERLRDLSCQYRFAVNALKFVNPELTYTRYLFPAFGLREISRFCGRLVIEVNSDDLIEYSLKSRLTGYYNKIFREHVYSMADGLVFVTHELQTSPVFRAFTPKHACIANGVECDEALFIEAPCNSRPQLGFIGSPGQAWHGLDKLGKLAPLLPSCDFHVVGTERIACEALWKEVPANISIHGYKRGVAVWRLMASMDVGVSTLALHRKGMDEACPLKARQYFAHGLPVIGAYFDTDIPSDCDFYLRLPNIEGNVSDSVGMISKFIRGVFGQSGLRRRIRSFAENNLDVGVKEAQRLEFFKAVIERR